LRPSYLVLRTSYLVPRTSYLVPRTSSFVPRTSYLLPRTSRHGGQAYLLPRPLHQWRRSPTRFIPQLPSSPFNTLTLSYNTPHTSLLPSRRRILREQGILVR